MPEQDDLTRDRLTGIIIDIRERYAAEGHTAFDIGNGLCEEFAHAVMEEWAGDGWIREEWQRGDWGTIWTDELLQIVDEEIAGWKEGSWGLSLPDEVDDDLLTEVALTEPAHNWIYFDGLHYDAEHPSGVANPLDLNFFRRWMQRPLLEDPASRHVAETFEPA